MPRDSEIAAVFRDYPRIYFGCHRRHVREPKSGALISTHQVSILDHLDAIRSTTLGELADHMGVTAGTMSIAVGRLVGDGYMTRSLDEKDRRRVRLRLTAKGVRVCTANSVLDEKLVADMLDQLEPEDRRKALDGLALLATAAGRRKRRVRGHRRNSTGVWADLSPHRSSPPGR